MRLIAEIQFIIAQNGYLFFNHETLVISDFRTAIGPV
jgi:hypothetical protein